MDNQDKIQQENANNVNYELEKYKITLDFLKFEATTLWQIFATFFTGHAILLGFTSNLIANNIDKKIPPVLLLISGIIGFVLAFLWFGVFHANSKWYYYRMKEQAKRDEENFLKSINDEKWFLLNKDAEKFANNNWFIKNKDASYIMIFIFILIYIILIIYSLSLICCCHCYH